MESFALFLIAAILVESMINLIQNVKEKETSWKYWGSLIVGLVVGVLLSVNYNLDLLKMVGFPEGNIPYFGPVVTGLIIGRGGNYASDLLSRLNTG